MLKRQKQVTVRFTEEEYHQLKNKCDAAGMKMEPFLRALVSGCTIRERPPDSYKALAAQVAAVGNNLNQLTRLANSTGKIENFVFEFSCNHVSSLRSKCKKCSGHRQFL